MSTIAEYAESSVQGGARAVASALLIHPIENVKTQSKASDEKLRAILFRMGQDPKRFYDGVSYYAGRKGMNQLWVWPVMFHGEKVIAKTGFDTENHPLATQVIIGQGITAVNFLSGGSELERKRIEAITGVKAGLFQVALPYLVKNSLNWSSFLLFQKLYRTEYRKITGKNDLSLSDQTVIGTATTVTVGTLSAIPDRWQTLALTSKATFRQVINKPTNKTAAALNAFALWGNNVLSIIWIEAFSPQ